MSIENKKGWGKILVAVRLEKMVESDFFRSWTLLLTKGLRKGDRFQISHNYTAQTAANELVRLFLKSDADTIFFLDSDAVIDEKFLEKMRSFEPGFEYDILQGFYTRRGWPPEAIWFKRDAYGKLHPCMVLEETTEEVAFVGLHCTLIRRKVFEKMMEGGDPKTFNWFWYPRETGETEDVAFSYEAEAAGFKIGATTHVKSEHIAHLPIGWDAYQDYLVSSGQIDQMKVYDELVELVVKKTGLPLATVLAEVAKGSQNPRESWEQKNPVSVDEVRRFYGVEDNGYLFDLVAWNSSRGYLQMTSTLQQVHDKSVLVIGPGLGTEIRFLLEHPSNQIDVFELPGILREFCVERFSGEPRVTFLEGDTLKEALEEKLKSGKQYHLVVAMDVVEHVHPIEINEFLNQIDLALASSGIFFAHLNFEEHDKKLYPMHYLETQQVTKQFISAKFTPFLEGLIWKKN